MLYERLKSKRALRSKKFEKDLNTPKNTGSLRRLLKGDKQREKPQPDKGSCFRRIRRVGSIAMGRGDGAGRWPAVGRTINKEIKKKRYPAGEWTADTEPCLFHCVSFVKWANRNLRARKARSNVCRCPLPANQIEKVNKFGANIIESGMPI